VIIREEVWDLKKGWRAHYEERTFVRYSPGRGIVSVETVHRARGIMESDYSDAAVGRWAIPEHYELHGDFSEENY